MNSKILVGIVLAVVAALGYWMYVGNSMTAGVTGTETNENASVGKTFAQLLGMGQSLECTYEYNDGANVSSGRMYMANGGESIRGDFNFTQSGAGAMEMHMIRVDGYNHIWGSSLPQGIKMRVTEENKGELFDSYAGQDVSAINNTNYSCSAWSGDPSKFVLPSNVEFMDIGDLQKMMGAPKIGEATGVEADSDATSPDMKAIQCAACDQAGAAREQCRQALGCK